MDFFRKSISAFIKAKELDDPDADKEKDKDKGNEKELKRIEGSRSKIAPAESMEMAALDAKLDKKLAKKKKFNVETPLRGIVSHFKV